MQEVPWVTFYSSLYILFRTSSILITEKKEKRKSGGSQRLHEQSCESKGILKVRRPTLNSEFTGGASEPSGFFFFLHDHTPRKLASPSFLFPAILCQLLLKFLSTVIPLLFFSDWCLSTARYHPFLSFLFPEQLWFFSCLYIFPSHTWVLLIWVSLFSFHFLWLMLTLWHVLGIKRLQGIRKNT